MHGCRSPQIPLRACIISVASNCFLGEIVDLEAELISLNCSTVAYTSTLREKDVLGRRTQE